MLLASATTLPLLLTATGCRSSAVFAGPDPLAGRPSLAPDVITLQAVIAAEQTMIRLYEAAVNGGLAAGQARRLAGLLAQHRQHLGLLQARLVVPAGAPAASPSGSPGGTVAGRVTIARLRAAERASAAGLVRRLVTVQPALAQLFASIAASDATHAVALSG